MSECVSETLLLRIHRIEADAVRQWVPNGGANGILCAGIPPFGTASASETFYFQSSDLPHHPSDSISLCYWHNVYWL